MSPEQVEGRPLDTRSDIYSFGVTCYHMLAGQPPFAGETALQVAVQHLRAEPPPLARLRSDLPPALCAMIHKMLAKQPEQRFASAHEIVKLLRSIAAACGVDIDEHAHAAVPGDMTSACLSRQALTGQLQLLMRPADAGRSSFARRPWRLALVVLIPFVVGLAAARLSRPDSLFSLPAAPSGSAAPASAVVAPDRPAGSHAPDEPVDSQGAAARPADPSPSRKPAAHD
jgi:serine/threonine-protein kinase